VTARRPMPESSQLVARLRRRGLPAGAACDLDRRLANPPRRLSRPGATVADVLAWADRVSAPLRARIAGGSAVRVAS